MQPSAAGLSVRTCTCPEPFASPPVGIPARTRRGVCERNLPKGCDLKNWGLDSRGHTQLVAHPFQATEQIRRAMMDLGG